MKKTVSSLLTAAIAISSFASGNTNDDNTNTTSHTYVLVHGAWQAPYVWDAVKNELNSKGNKVVVVELPGHGADNTATYTLSIDAYRDIVIEAITKVNEKVILVGHSMGWYGYLCRCRKSPFKNQ